MLCTSGGISQVTQRVLSVLACYLDTLMHTYIIAAQAACIASVRKEQDRRTFARLICAARFPVADSSTRSFFSHARILRQQEHDYRSGRSERSSTGDPI